jgi:H+/Cl- antiporter ClcA
MNASILQDGNRMNWSVIVGLGTGALLGLAFHSYVLDDDRRKLAPMAAGAGMGALYFA